MRGWEAKGEWRFLPEWTLACLPMPMAQYRYRRPIDSVDPFKVIGGIRYPGASAWGGELRTTYVAEKNRVSAAVILVVPEHMTVDSLISFEIAPAITLNAGIFNIINASYFDTADIAGMSASDPLLRFVSCAGTYRIDEF